MKDKGTLYGVGVGPGDPELLTLKAVRTIEACPVIAAPRTPGGDMVALDIARQAVDLSGKTILPWIFPCPPAPSGVGLPMRRQRPWCAGSWRPAGMWPC